MAYATYVDQRDGTGTGVASVTTGSFSGLATDDVIVVRVQTRRASDPVVTGVSGCGATWTELITTTVDEQSQLRATLWVGVVGALPLNEGVTVTLNTSSDSVIARALRYTGADPAAPVEVYVYADTGAVDTDAPTIDVTPASNEATALGLVGLRISDFTWDGGHTVLGAGVTVGSAGNQIWIHSAEKQVPTPTTTTLSGTIDRTRDWQIIGAVVKAAGATVDPPETPTADAATDLRDTSFRANWTPSATGGGASTYRLDVATDNLFLFPVAGYDNLDTGSVDPYYSVTGLAAETTYYYRVRAENSGGASASSNTVSVATLRTPQVFVVTDDTYTASGSPNSNYGSAALIEVDSGDASLGDMTGFLKFSVSGLEGTVVQTILRIYCDNLGSPVEIAPVNGTAWDENTLTYNNQPTVGTSITQFAAVQDTWNEIDVTSHIDGDGTFALAIVATGSNDVRWDSKDNASGRAPEIEVFTDGTGAFNGYIMLLPLIC